MSLAKEGASIYCAFGTEGTSVLSQKSQTGSNHDVGLEAMVTARKRTLAKDRLKDRSDIGEVEFSIEKQRSK